ncbi:MAG: hypothetical protein KBE22_00170 [Candidatus Accumulibacter sp.]|nr:hypothetical protein [Accumulibacter sp.]
MSEMDKSSADALTLTELTTYLDEISEQPPWRWKADREADYCDGNQLDAEILQRMQQIGIPPAIEPLMGPVIASVLGMEVKNRGDWKVSTESQDDPADVADALNQKLHEAEGRSHADTACSNAFKPQISIGLGWVYVGREEDPFKYPYKAEAVPRNEMFWDWHAKHDLSDARYVIRKRWFDKRIPELLFPDHADLIRGATSGWRDFGIGATDIDDSGRLPALFAAQDQERRWSIEEINWLDTARSRVALMEVWYRRWSRVSVLRYQDGRVVEYDKRNPAHSVAIARGLVAVEKPIVSKVRLSWWLGPHCLHDGPSPHAHGEIPYVPFFGYREDRTGAPYAMARGMMYLQDQINALHSKSQWMMAARRVTRTKGAVVGDDEQFRQEVARPDADVILDPKAMQNGGIFEVKTDLQLTQQQFQRLADTREAIRRVGGIYSEFQGQNGNTTSGVQFNSQVEQSNQSLADLMDNFKTARAKVGDILLSLIIEDTKGKRETVFLDGKGIQDDRTVELNVPVADESGIQYLDNDVARIKMRVGIDNVPSAATFKQQQLGAMSEAFKSAPPQYQPIMLPFLLSLMDVPYQAELIKAIKEQQGQQSPEQIEDQIKQAVDQALIKARADIELQKLQQQQPLVDAQIKKLIAETVGQNVTSFFSGTNAANQIAMQPAVAPMADAMLASAGFIDANAAPIIPSAPAGVIPIEAPTNTSPNFPPNPDAGVTAGIETGVTQ